MADNAKHDVPANPVASEFIALGIKPETIDTCLSIVSSREDIRPATMNLNQGRSVNPNAELILSNNAKLTYIGYDVKSGKPTFQVDTGLGSYLVAIAHVAVNYLLDNLGKRAPVTES
jgi:hypothetical protein